MKKKKLYAFLAGALVSAFLTTAFLITPTGSDVYVSVSNLFGGSETAKLMRIEKIINKRYMGEVKNQYMTNVAATSYMRSLGDKYSTYFTSDLYKRMQENLSGDYHGIGIQIEKKDEKILITNIMENYPAQKAGLMEGDYILSFNGVPCDGSSIQNITDTIKNTKEGDAVSVVVERNGFKLDFTIVVEKIELDYIKPELLQNGVGYVRIDTFGTGVSEEFKTSVNELIEKGATSLVFDVRSNPGGALDTVVEMVDFLVGEGTIVTVKHKDNKEEVYTSDKDEINLPMCVLINSESASASEIFAAALSEYEKADLVGKNTFGKGVVQGIFDLGDNTAISVTIAKYYTPSGICIDGTGVAPDVEVDLPESVTVKEYNAHIFGDVQLQAALEILKNK